MGILLLGMHCSGWYYLSFLSLQKIFKRPKTDAYVRRWCVCAKLTQAITYFCRMQLPFLFLTLILAMASVFIRVDAAATSFSTFKKETADKGSLELDTLETASYLLCAVKCHNK